MSKSAKIKSSKAKMEMELSQAVKPSPKHEKEADVEKVDFYRLDEIKSKHAQYNMIIGKRSNGKTYACLEEILKNWVLHGKQGAYLRREKEDFRGKRGESLFNAHGDCISQLTNGEFDRVKYYSGKWYLAYYEPQDDKIYFQDEPFCYAFAINDMEHDKSTSYPDITTIVFDEFLAKRFYLTNEFVLFMNVLSTIIRHRNDVTVYMLGNTVNKYCPYFREMGIEHVAEMKLGQIDVYTYGDSQLKVAVHRAENPKSDELKKSDVYFAFDNPSLQMITGGDWELNIYPHLTTEYERQDILLNYFIVFNGQTLHCEVVQKDNELFTYIHRKTTPIHDLSKDIIFSFEHSARPNQFYNLYRCTNKIGKRLFQFFKEDRVFYQDNDVGDMVRNYLNECAKTNILTG